MRNCEARIDLGGKHKVLIIDHETELLDLLQNDMTKRYQIVTSADFNQCQDLIAKNDPDCLLLDVHLSHMHGVENIRQVHYAHPDLPIILMTDVGDENIVMTALKYGAVNYVQKPLDLPQLFQEIDEAIEHAQIKRDEANSTDILIIDNDEALINTFQQDCESLNYQLHIATTLGQAFDIVNTKRLDILILNHDLDQAHSFDLIEKLDAQDSHTLTIVLSTELNEDTMLNAIKHGIFDYLSKPLSNQELLASINRGLDKLKSTKKLHLKNLQLEEKKRALEHLTLQIKEQKNYVEKIIKSITNILFVVDAEGNVITSNDIASNELGYEPSELLKMRLHDIIDHEDVDALLGSILELGSQHNFESNYCTRDGKLIPILFSANTISTDDSKKCKIICIAQNISIHKEHEHKLIQLAHYDNLTQLPNRVLFQITVEREIRMAKNKQETLALLYIDLDNFKNVNDRLGHHFGDSLLKKATERFQEQLNSNDFIARLGGDEFAAILVGLEDSHHAGLMASKIIKAINLPFNIRGNEILIGASVGIAIYPTAGEDSITLAKNADIALYQAKKSGRNKYRYFTQEMDKKHRRQLFLENELRFAIMRDQLFLQYQPIFDLRTRDIVKIEALLRWQHPQLGLVPPDVFVPIAESIGFISTLGEWVLEKAFSAYLENSFLEDNQIILSINLSVIQIGHYNFVKSIQSKGDYYKINPQYVEFEVTESAIMSHPEEAKEVLNKLRHQGYSIAIDDFGTGYSSLSYLKQLPINTVKIDKSFLQTLSANQEKLIIKSILALAKILELDVIAEGIESEAQLSFLLQNGCYYGQGYLFCYATTLDNIQDLL